MIFAGSARVYEFDDDVFADSFQITIPPGFPRIGRRRTSTFIHRTVVGATGRVRFDFVGLAPNNVDAAAIRSPARYARSKMFVGIGDAAIVLFLEIVVGQIRIGAAAQPERFDKLLALFVGGES